MRNKNTCLLSRYFGWILLFFLFSCDTFQEDALPKDKLVLINSSEAVFYILPGSSTIIDLKSVVNSSFVEVVMKVSKFPTHGSLTTFGDFLLKYEPKVDFIDDSDNFEITISDTDGKSLKAFTVKVVMRLDISDFPCGVYGVMDDVVTGIDKEVSIGFLANDRICGFTKSLLQSSIYSKPKNGQASLVGDSIIIYKPDAGFAGIDEIVYKIIANKNSKPSNNTVPVVSFGIIKLDVGNHCDLLKLGNYYLDLTDNLEDQRSSSGECGTAYYAPFWASLKNLCADGWASSSIKWVSSTNHSGGFCMGTDGSICYMPDLVAIAKNDTAKVEICITGDCKEVTFYVINESQGKWSRQVLVSGFDNPFHNIFFVDENVGFISGAAGILKTTNGGKNWQHFTVPSKWIHEMYFHDANNGFLGCEEGLLRTTNGGASWKLTRFKYPVTSVFFTSSTTGFIGTSSEYGDFGTVELFKTVDGATTWDLVDRRESTFTILNIRFVTPTIGYALAFGLVLKTVDSGNSWQTSYSNSDLQGRMYAMNGLTISNSVLFAIRWAPTATFFSGSIVRSVDGVIWNYTGAVAGANSIAFSPSGGLGFAFAFDSNRPILYMSHNAAVTWEIESLNDVQPLAAAVPSDKVAYLLSGGGLLLKYDDR